MTDHAQGTDRSAARRHSGDALRPRYQFRPIRPCPVCGGTKDCRQRECQGRMPIVHCHHTHRFADVIGAWVRIGEDSQGFQMWERRDGGSFGSATPTTDFPPMSSGDERTLGISDPVPEYVSPRKAPDYSKIAQHIRDRSRVNVFANEKLCRELGLPWSAVDAFDIRLHSEQQCKWWAIPVYDGNEEWLGYSIRPFGHGQKKWRGPKDRGDGRSVGKGLFFLPGRWREASRDPNVPVFCPEGFTDAATLIGAGLSAIGRPNDRQGGECLAKLLLRHPLRSSAEAPIVVLIGDNDRNASGLKGVVACAKRMIKLGLPASLLRISFLRNTKDVRTAWNLSHPGMWDDRLAEVRTALRSFGDRLQDELLADAKPLDYWQGWAVEAERRLKEGDVCLSIEALVQSRRKSTEEIVREMWGTPPGAVIGATPWPERPRHDPHKRLGNEEGPKICVRGKVVLLMHRTDPKGLLKLVRPPCRTYKCDVCRAERMETYRRTIRHHLGELPQGTRIVHFVVTSDAEWKNMAKAFSQRDRRKGDAKFFRIRTMPRMECYQVFATWSPQNATHPEEIAVAQAIEKAEILIDRIETLNWTADELTGGRFFSHSQAWNIRENGEIERTGEWEKLSTLSVSLKHATHIVDRHNYSAEVRVSGKATVVNVSPQERSDGLKLTNLIEDLQAGECRNAPEDDPLEFGDLWPRRE